MAWESTFPLQWPCIYLSVSEEDSCASHPGVKDLEVVVTGDVSVNDAGLDDEQVTVQVMTVVMKGKRKRES
jgi:hypothetical protein